MLAEDLLALLRSFALRTKSPTIDMHQFAASLPKGRVQPGEIDARVDELAAAGSLTVAGDAGAPRVLTLTDFALFALTEEYRQLAVDPSRPFPREGSTPAPVPEEGLISADVKGQLGTLMDSSANEPGSKTIVTLQFADNVDALIVPLRSVGSDLIEASVARLSRYLQESKNQGYAEGKLLGALRGSEVLVRQSLEDVVLRPKKAAATVLTPTEFSFRFWTHFSNIVLQDFRAKKEKTDQDQGACQSAYIVGYAVFHKKGAVRREKEWAEDRKTLEQQVRKPPFVFGFQELYLLKDDKGATYVAKNGREFIHSFLREKTTRVGDEALPFLVRVHAATQKKDYFIFRDLLVPVFLKKLAEASEELRRQYLDEWLAEMREDRTPAVAKSDAAFRRDVELRVVQGHALLAALANGALLHVAGEETRISADAKAELKKCFAVENILRPYDELLGLSCGQLVKNVRIYLPFWLTVPVLSSILRLFRRMVAGRKAADERKDGQDAKPAKAPVLPAAHAPPAETVKLLPSTGGQSPKGTQSKADLLRYKRSIQALASHYVPTGTTIDATLEGLAEKWNPLFAQQQKRDLVDDVNALVRDFIRPVRRSFLMRPPDLKRIHALAEQLSESKSLAQIKKRDPLMRYLELYMIRCLQVKV